MFVCEKCIEKYEGPAVTAAQATRALVFFPRLSYGPCEVCHETGGCYDIPSSAQWLLKKQFSSAQWWLKKQWRRTCPAEVIDDDEDRQLPRRS